VPIPNAIMERMENHPASLSEEELATLAWLLRRFCIADLDQWERWRLTTPGGEVFVNVVRELPTKISRDAYTSLDEWADRHA
jgi:hypothetical protein